MLTGYGTCYRGSKLISYKDHPQKSDRFYFSNVAVKTLITDHFRCDVLLVRGLHSANLSTSLYPAQVLLLFYFISPLSVHIVSVVDIFIVE